MLEWQLKLGDEDPMSSFKESFKRATGNDPYPYQRRFAEEGDIPQLVDVPTGLGKTAMAVLHGLEVGQGTV